MKKWELALLLGLILALCITQFTSFSKACEEVRGDTLRLHILANSDSEGDQACKLAVRDALLLEYGSLFTTARTQREAVATAQSLLPSLQRTAVEAVARAGYSLPVSVRLEKMYFSTRVYETFTLPAGDYDAVRVEIGSAAGKNWFCVMYPPLCLPAAAEDNTMAVYSPREKKAITSGCTVKFAVLEWLQKA